MPLPAATFQTRTITAVFFVAAMLTGLLWNQWSFFVLFSIIHFGCWNEFQQIVGKIDPGYEKISPFHKYSIRIAGWSLLLFCAGDRFILGPLPLYTLGLWLGITFWFILPLIELLFAKNIRPRNILYSAAGFLYLSLPFALCIQLYSVSPFQVGGKQFSIPDGYIVIAIILAIWINDTMAYIVGSLVGRTPLSNISPKKTWEGTIGGILLSIAALCIPFAALPGMHALWVPFGVLIGLAAIAGTLGDLLESKLKRMAGLKDSGNILPGHGGFLDRFDSLILALPLCWLFVQCYLAFLHR